MSARMPGSSGDGLPVTHGFTVETPDEREALLHAARQRGRIFALLAGKPDLGEQLHRIVGRGTARRAEQPADQFGIAQLTP